MNREYETSYEEDMLSPCGDSGCILRDPTDKTPRQYTNGGCQHLKERGPQLTKLLVLMGAEIVRLRVVNNRLIENLDLL